jgi:hypothetical protein
MLIQVLIAWSRYLIQHPEFDPDWKAHSSNLVEFVTWALVFNNMPREPALQWGARAVSEQRGDENKMVSHTSRYASVMAMLAEKTGNATLATIARRSWDWSSYMTNHRGRVVVGPVDQSMWFTDGYGDFIRNTMHMLGANASWSPVGQTHILRSSSVVTDVQYQADGGITYSTFDHYSEEKLSVAFVPAAVVVDGMSLSRMQHWETAHADEDSPSIGWWFGGQSGRELRIRHAGDVVSVAVTDTRTV